MEVSKENIHTFLAKLNFFPKDGEINSYTRVFPNFHNYEIKVSLDEVNFKYSKIDYGDKIKIVRNTVTNFTQQENFVVLECVCRLILKGYHPENITLEKEWQLGHKNGYLDILVSDNSNKTYLMIECKTWGDEYKKEIEKTYVTGSQIFSYFNHDKNTKLLCLYSSCLNNNYDISYKNSIIKVNEKMKNALNPQEAFELWKPQVFETNGIFEEQSKPYNSKFIGLKKEDLIPLTKEDGGDIFNRFAEILRKNVVSDKTNAYNKIFNLFLCKIVDEYKTNEEDKLKFQWEDSESNEDVLLRLNELYKEGMNQYLNLTISSIDINQIEKQIKGLKTQKDKDYLKKLFIEQKLYTSNDFAFREVFDKKTFDLNCIVVKEVVKLLERYKIRYETKQQFLGDFFEKLLNTGIKQEVGQFFTPVPIAQFICKSLPIDSIIKEKNSKKENYILPYVIDYSSGSGHFLTEIMGEIEGHISLLTVVEPQI